jgi:hypothetical protein
VPEGEALLSRIALVEIQISGIIDPENIPSVSQQRFGNLSFGEAQWDPYGV